MAMQTVARRTVSQLSSLYGGLVLRHKGRGFCVHGVNLSGLSWNDKNKEHVPANGACERTILGKKVERTQFLGYGVFQQIARFSTLLSTAFSVSHELSRKPLIGNLGQKRNIALDLEKTNCSHGEENKETISVTFVDKDGEEKTIQVPVGMSMLEAAHQNDIDLEGACEGSLACSTCHVIVMDENYYKKLEEPTDDENDMLDLAFGLTELSRLGCQVIARPELDGMRLALPAATRNFAVDGYVPKPH